MGDVLDDQARAAAQWEAALAGLVSPVGRALLVDRYVRWLAAAALPAEAAAALAGLVGLDKAGEDPRARAVIRGSLRSAAGWLAEQGHPLPSGLPGWATDPLAPGGAERVEQWLEVAGSGAEAGFLGEHVEDLVPGGAVEAAARLLAQLKPGHSGLERPSPSSTMWPTTPPPPLAGLDHANAVVDRVQHWLATRTWRESQTYLREHAALLADPAAHRLLEQAEAGGDREAGRHAAILTLWGAGTDADDVFDIVEDVVIATERSLRAVRGGDLDDLLVTLRLHPGVLGVPVHGPLVLAVLGLLDAVAGDGARPEDFAARIAAGASRLQVREAAALLRAAAAHWPHRAGSLTGLAELVESAAPGEATDAEA